MRASLAALLPDDDLHYNGMHRKRKIGGWLLEAGSWKLAVRVQFFTTTARTSSFQKPASSFQEDAMSLQIGIVGLPNAGKSTLFNALTHSRRGRGALSVHDH